MIVKSLLSGLSEPSELNSDYHDSSTIAIARLNTPIDPIFALQILLRVLQVRRGHHEQVLSLVPLSSL